MAVLTTEESPPQSDPDPCALMVQIAAPRAGLRRRRLGPAAPDLSDQQRREVVTVWMDFPRAGHPDQHRDPEGVHPLRDEGEFPGCVVCGRGLT